MMYRISLKFGKYIDNETLVEYFEGSLYQRHSEISNQIIKNEFERCHYSNTIRLFKNLVKGYTYLFVEE